MRGVHHISVGRSNETDGDRLRNSPRVGAGDRRRLIEELTETRGWRQTKTVAEPTKSYPTASVLLAGEGMEIKRRRSRKRKKNDLISC